MNETPSRRMPDDTPHSPLARAVVVFEMLVLYAAIPLGFAYWMHDPEAVGRAVVALGWASESPEWLEKPGRFLFPALLFGSALLVLLLVRSKTFRGRQLWNAKGVARELPRILTLWAIGGGLAALAVWLFLPGRLFELPIRNPGLWAVIMVAYPVFSVFPQEIIFRTYFAHRARWLLGNGVVFVLVNGVAFALAHALFLNWVAVAMCLPGGVLFAITYVRSRSTLATAIEHALWGCLIFTIGLGRFFYAGAAGS